MAPTPLRMVKLASCDSVESMSSSFSSSWSVERTSRSELSPFNGPRAVKNRIQSRSWKGEGKAVLVSLAGRLADRQWWWKFQAEGMRNLSCDYLIVTGKTLYLYW